MSPIIENQDDSRTVIDGRKYLPAHLEAATLDGKYVGSTVAADTAEAKDVARAAFEERSRYPAFMVGSYYGTTLKPWGVGDDTVAIQNAIDAASQAGGGRVVIPYTGTYVPRASQIVLPKWVHFSGSSWNSFGASGNVGRLYQLSGVNDDFIIFSDNGDTVTNRPFIGPQSITDLVIRAASGSTAGHGIAFRVQDGRTALTQDFSTFQRINARGFAGSGIYIKGGSPLIIEDVATLWNTGHGIEIVDPHVDTNNYSVHHLVLTNISGDGNMGYGVDLEGATVYLEGQTKSYATTMRGIKSEMRIRPTSDSGNNVQMGNAHAIILNNCESQIDITGVTHIATGSQTQRPKSEIIVKGTVRPNLTWTAIGIRSEHPLQTGTIAPVVEDAVHLVNYFESHGELGPITESAVAGLTTGESTMRRREITSTGATQTAGSLRLSYFTAEKTELINTVRTMSGSTAAVASTLCRIGVYTVATNGDLTLVASTANDTALWSATSTSYGKTFTSSFTKRKKQRYAVGTLVVGATTAPNLMGQSQLLAAEAAQPPRLCGSVSGQTDLPSTVAFASVSDTTIQVYAALAP